MLPNTLDDTSVLPALAFTKSSVEVLLLGRLGRTTDTVEPEWTLERDYERTGLAWLRTAGVQSYSSKPAYLFGGRPEAGRFALITTLEGVELASAEKLLRAALHFAERAASAVVVSVAPSLRDALLTGSTGAALERLRAHPGARWLYLVPEDVKRDGRQTAAAAPILGLITASLARTRTLSKIVGLETGGAVDPLFEIADAQTTLDAWHRYAGAGLVVPLRAADGRTYYPALLSFARRTSEPFDAEELGRHLPRTLFCSALVGAGWMELRFALPAPDAEKLQKQLTEALAVGRVQVAITPAVGGDRAESAIDVRVELPAGDGPSVRFYYDEFQKRPKSWRSIFSKHSKERGGSDAGMHVDGEDLSGVNVSHGAYADSTFADCVFDGAMITNTKLQRAGFVRCAGRGVAFDLNNLEGSRWLDCSFAESFFSGARFIGGHMSGCKLRGSNFVDADMRRATFVDTSFAGVSLLDVKLDDAVFRGCVFHGATPDPRTLGSNITFEDCLFDDGAPDGVVRTPDMRTPAPRRARIAMPAMPDVHRAPGEPWELPLKILYIDDFTEKPDPRPIEDRRPVSIDRSHGRERWSAPLTSTPRGAVLARFAEELEPNEDLFIDLMNASKEDLTSDYEDAADLPRSGLYKIIYSSEYASLGGRPYGALVLGHAFGASKSDPTLLQKIAATCARAHVPVIFRRDAEPCVRVALRAVGEPARYAGFGDPVEVGRALVQSFLAHGLPGCWPDPAVPVPFGHAPGGVGGVEPAWWAAARVAQCIKARYRHAMPTDPVDFTAEWLSSLATLEDDGVRPFVAATLRATPTEQTFDFELLLNVREALGVAGGVVTMHGVLDRE